jgi:hypothetical protein
VVIIPLTYKALLLILSPNIKDNSYQYKLFGHAGCCKIGQEETNIRSNPKARVTALLKDVFK